MFRALVTLSRALASHTSAFVIIIAIAAMLQPSLFGWVQQGQTASIILGLIMLTMGCTLSVDDFRQMLSHPLHIFIGSVAQYTIMPCVAWALSQIFGLDPFLSAGIILVGCCPGGVSSNLMSFLCGGDVAFSVGMTTASTLLAPLVTPLLVLILAGQSIEVNALGMFQNILLVTLLPVGIGCMFNFLLGKNKHFNDIQAVMPGVSVVCLAFIVGGVIFTVHPQLVERGIALLMLTLSVVFCHNALGYLLGYTIGRLLHWDKPKCRTISLEVGMQNAGMATVLANNFFATPAAIAANPLAALSVVPCAISCAYHSISGTILAGLFRKYSKG